MNKMSCMFYVCFLLEINSKSLRGVSSLVTRGKPVSTARLGYFWHKTGYIGFGNCGKECQIVWINKVWYFWCNARNIWLEFNREKVKVEALICVTNNKNKQWNYG